LEFGGLWSRCKFTEKSWLLNHVSGRLNYREPLC
jgi:hypothetical protein